MKDKILEALNRALVTKANEPFSEWVSPYKPTEDYLKHQFAIFLKPEVTDFNRGVKVNEVLQMVFDSFEKWNVEIKAIRVLSAEYLRLYEIMDGHYGIINKVSKGGYEVISAEAREAMNQTFHSELNSDAEIIGAHQFLARFSDMSARSLYELSDKIGVKKLANGTYCTPVEHDGQKYLVLSPFHPYQLEFFTTKGRAIVVMEGLSSTSWRDLRQQMIGSTNPAKAAQDSIRRTFLNRLRELGIHSIDSGTNGIHLSAGPLEAMVEIQRFFSNFEQNGVLGFEETSFGRMLLAQGFTLPQVESLSLNPTLNVEGRSIPAFDLTEEMNATDAANRLKMN